MLWYTFGVTEAFTIFDSKQLKIKHGEKLGMKDKIYPILRSVYMFYIGVMNHFVSRIPFNSLRIFIYRNLYFMKIGSGTQINMGVTFRRPRSIVIGNNTNIHSGCFLDGLSTLTIGDNVDIGDQVLIYCGGHDIQSPDYGPMKNSITIENYACIFARAMLVKGGIIGEGAVVGAGAIVTRDVPPYTIVAGNPAHKIGERTRDLSYSLNPKFTNRSW
jgi:acetyltransferase-like isoleucine patch superfamily enzyme